MLVPRTTTGLAGSLLLALLLTGCGGGGDDAAPAGPATTPASTAAGTPSSSPAAPPSGAATPASSAPATAPATPAAAAGAAGPARCSTGSLRVGLGPAEGAAGSTYRPLTFVNTGTTPCTLDGHPGVSYVAGADGHQVGAAAGRTGATTSVTLAPGTTAHATLREVNAQDYDPATCSPTAVTGLRVYPPDQTASAFVPAVGTGCAAEGVVLLTVGPVSAGSSG